MATAVKQVAITIKLPRVESSLERTLEPGQPTLNGGDDLFVVIRINIKSFDRPDEAIHIRYLVFQ